MASIKKAVRSSHADSKPSYSLSDLQGALAVVTKDLAPGSLRHITCDLCDHTFSGKLHGPLVLTSNTTLCRGTLKLGSRREDVLLIRGAECVCLDHLNIISPKKHATVVNNTPMVTMGSASSVRMHACVLEGGSAVAVFVEKAEGAESHSTVSTSLTAEHCSMHGGGSALLVAGGSVQLSDCSLCDCATRGGLSVLGEESSACATRCTFSRNHQGNVGVAEGACVTLDECECDGSKGSGIYVSGIGSTLVASRSSVASSYGHNIAVSDGSCIDLSHCDASSSNSCGLLVSGRDSAATLQRCFLNGNHRRGVCVREGASVKLEGCECDLSRTGFGWELSSGASLVACDTSVSYNSACNAYVAGDGSRADLRGCALDCSVKGAGLNVTRGGHASADGCSISSNSYPNMGVGMTGCASACLRSCKLDDSRLGGLVALKAGTTVNIVDTSISRSGVNAVQVTEGASCTLQSCMCDHSAIDGFLLADPGTRVRASDTSVSSSSRFNANVQTSAAADLRACRLLHGVSGLIVYGSRDVSCTETVISGSMQKNVQVLGGGLLSLRACECSNSSKGSGCSVMDMKSRLEASQGKFLNNQDGNICVRQGGAAVCTDCIIEGSTGGGGLLVLDSPSAAKATDCSISNNQFSGVQVMGGIAGLNRCTLQGNVMCGIMAVGHNAVATASACTISGNRLNNVRAQDRGVITLDGCQVGVAAD